MKKILLLSLLTVLLGSCRHDDSAERAAQMLDDARFALRWQHYAAARDTILQMRKRYPTAIEARRQGIFLLDSIEMQAAADSLAHATGDEWSRLHIKQLFFERKLQEDRKKDKGLGSKD